MPRAKFIGIEETLDVFLKKANTPYWALYEGKTLHADFCGDDMEESVQELQEELTRLKNRGFTSVFILHNYDTKPIKGDKVYKLDQKIYPCRYPIYFSLNETTSAVGAMQPGYYQAVSPMDSRVIERLNSMESTINALAANINNEEEEEEEQPGEIDKIANLLNNDTVKTLIGAITGYLVKQPAQAPRVASLGNIDESWEEVLNKLFSKGVRLEHLQKLAEMPEAKIQMLISML
jgi:hypothetical protein